MGGVEDTEVAAALMGPVDMEMVAGVMEPEMIAEDSVAGCF